LICAVVLSAFLFGCVNEPKELPINDAIKSVSNAVGKDLRLRKILDKYEKEELPQLLKSKYLTREEKRFLILYLKIKEIEHELPYNFEQIR